MEKELIKFYQNLKQDIRATQLSEENGGNSEQIFTQISVNSLADAGETENVSLAFDKKAQTICFVYLHLFLKNF